MMELNHEKFWIVVPLYNEEKLIPHTLKALLAQSDQNFSLCCVDNNSTDRSHEIIQQFCSDHPEMNIHIITEEEKGTGAASDTGFRYAINQGAQYVARTDADAMPCRLWVELLKKDFINGKKYIGGRIAPRRDEETYRWYDGVIAPLLIRMFEKAPRLFYSRPEHRYPLFMVPGLNMAIESQLYMDVGGFPRSSIDDTDEDLELHMKVACVLDREQVTLNKKAVVYGSMRKAKAMGYLGILLWYWGRKRVPENIDIR